MPRKSPTKKADSTPVVSDELVLEGDDFLVLQTATTIGDETKKEYIIVIEENYHNTTPVVRVPSIDTFKRLLTPPSPP